MEWTGRCDGMDERMDRCVAFVLVCVFVCVCVLCLVCLCLRKAESFNAVHIRAALTWMINNVPCSSSSYLEEEEEKERDRESLHNALLVYCVNSPFSMYLLSGQTSASRATSKKAASSVI